MLSKLTKMLKKVFGSLGQKGYTLIEVAAVVAVTATLAAVVVPVAMDKIQKSKEATAADDVKSLASAVSGFFGDTGVWPAHSGTTANYLYGLRVATTDSTSTFGSGTDDPSVSGSGWNAATGDRVDYAQRHLVVNKPGGEAGKYSNWAGPYAESLLKKKDPWGHNYFIWVRGMHEDSADAGFGWVISAGPDGVLQTSTTDEKLQGDDIGIAIYRKYNS